LALEEIARAVSAARIANVFFMFLNLLPGSLEYAQSPGKTAGDF